jgi:heme/copper-type cytochrome/quinol oxidase subunit 3
LITTILGLAFLILQWLGWKDMVGHSVYLVGNPSLVVVGQKLFLVVVVGRLTNNLFL